jgi:uncharacterized protein (DUF885 family)
MRMDKKTVLIWVLLLASVCAAGCTSTRPTERVTVPLTVVAQATPEPTEQPVEQPTATEQPVQQPTATEQPVQQPTATQAVPPATETPTLRPTATPSPLPTVTPTLEPTTTRPPTLVSEVAPPVADVVASLEDLPLDNFLEESYKQLILRSPYKLTELGVSGALGLRNDRLDDLSDAYIRETQKLEVAVLEILRGYDRSALSPEQQVSYDVYEYYLDNQVRGHEFMYHNYPLNHFLTSYHYTLNELLTSLHPLESRQDVADYISRLAQVDDQVEQLLNGIAIREQMGIIPPAFIIRIARQDILQYLQTTSADPATINAAALPVFTVLNEAITRLDDLSAEEEQVFRDTALAEIRESFIPAYVRLFDTLDHLMTVATDDAGVWKLPNGDAYYAYALRKETSTDLTPDEIHAWGLAEVVRIQAELRLIFDELGYPQGRNVGELIRRAIDQGGYYDTSQVVAAYEELLADMDARLDEVLDLRPQADVVVIGETAFGGGGYYLPGSADGSRPGAFHTGVGDHSVPKATMPTIAYHEAIPGHHTQVALAQELDLPTFRNDLFFNGHGEGWALYAERLAWEMGLYEDDPYGNVGRLQLELLRAVRMVVDTGIHAKGWTREQAQTYMMDNVGGWTHEVERYVVWPGQATGYMVGMLKILELRQSAMDQLGDRFDLKEFHNVVLGNGSVPLTILERMVDEYVASKLN